MVTAMARYIDADEIDLERVSDTICQWQAQEAIDDTPTADVVEVVRCSECRYSDYCHQEVNSHGIEHRIDFCSRGERRTDE